MSAPGSPSSEGQHRLSFEQLPADVHALIADALREDLPANDRQATVRALSHTSRTLRLHYMGELFRVLHLDKAAALSFFREYYHRFPLDANLYRCSELRLDWEEDGAVLGGFLLGSHVISGLSNLAISLLWVSGPLLLAEDIGSLPAGRYRTTRRAGHMGLPTLPSLRQLYIHGDKAYVCSMRRLIKAVQPHLTDLSVSLTSSHGLSLSRTRQLVTGFWRKGLFANSLTVLCVCHGTVAPAEVETILRLSPVLQFFTLTQAIRPYDVYNLSDFLFYAFRNYPAVGSSIRLFELGGSYRFDGQTFEDLDAMFSKANSTSAPAVLVGLEESIWSNSLGGTWGEGWWNERERAWRRGGWASLLRIEEVAEWP